MRDEVIDHSARTFDRRAAHHGRMTACVTRMVFIVNLRGRFHPRLLVCVCVCVRACLRLCVCVCRGFGLYVTCVLHKPSHRTQCARARKRTNSGLSTANLFCFLLANEVPQIDTRDLQHDHQARQATGNPVCSGACIRARAWLLASVSMEYMCTTCRERNHVRAPMHAH